MFTLPKSLYLQRDEAAEKGRMDKLRDVLGNNEREGIHASDLMDIKQSFWRKKKPMAPTDLEVKYFTIGTVLHELLLVHEDGEMDLPTVVHPEFGIHYSVDDEDEEGNPVELKTSRAEFEPKKVMDLDTYLEQLLIYMACRDKCKGRIDILYLSLRDDPESQYNKKKTPELRSYTVQVTQADLNIYKDQIKEKFGALTGALKAPFGSSPWKKLPHCRAWKCGTGKCPYWKECKPEGRHGIRAKKNWEK